MSQITDNRIIAPPIEQEVYPYRRVWRSISIQVIIMCVVSFLILFVSDILGIQFNELVNSGLSVLFVAMPFGLWMSFSVLPERFVLEPRTHLMTVAIISALAASAIGIPIIRDVFRISEWLPLESAIQRILGFTFTAGIIDTSIKLIIVRYFVFPQHLKIRTDTIAYCVASAIGYSTALNIYLISQTDATYGIVMIHVLSNFVMQLASGLILAYGLSETYFGNSISIFLPIQIIVASLVIGIISPLVSGLMNGSLSTAGSADRPIFSLFFMIAMLFVFVSITFFLYSVAEQRERQAFVADS